MGEHEAHPFKVVDRAGVVTKKCPINDKFASFNSFIHSIE